MLGIARIIRILFRLELCLPSSCVSAVSNHLRGWRGWGGALPMTYQLMGCVLSYQSASFFLSSLLYLNNCGCYSYLNTHLPPLNMVNIACVPCVHPCLSTFTHQKPLLHSSKTFTFINGVSSIYKSKGLTRYQPEFSHPLPFVLGCPCGRI